MNTASPRTRARALHASMVVALAALAAAGCSSETSSSLSPSARADDVIGRRFIITLSPTVISNLTVGQTAQITKKVTLLDGVTTRDMTLRWSTSNASVATVSSTGLVTAIGVGAAVITASEGGSSATTSVTVVPAVASLTLTPASLPSLVVGSSSTLTATAKDASGNVLSVAVTWASSDTTVAKIVNGVVTGMKVGFANVTATAGAKVAAAAVTVIAPVVSTPPSTTGSGVRATLPQVYLNTTMPTAPTGSQIISVSAGGNLQNALNSANPGDVIELAAGATFTGSFTLPAKSGSSWIVIRPSNWQQLPAAGSRMTATIAGQLALPKILANSSSPAITAGYGAHHWRIVGVEVSVASGITQNYGLVSMDAPSATTVSSLPHDVTLDRMYIHGTATMTLRRCVLLNAVAAAVIDSHLSGCHDPSQDSQAIAGWSGPGPFKIVNNYLEGAGENIMFGGADPSIANVVPSDIEIRQNHIYKPASYKGMWLVKNLFELKNAQRVLLEGNILDGSWTSGQVGFGIVLKTVNQSGSCTWCVTQDVTIRYNIMRNVGAAFNLASSPDNAFMDIHARRFTINDNVVYTINSGTFVGDGKAFQILDDLRDMVIVHNTLMSPTHTAINFGPGRTGLSSGTVYRDNLSFGGLYGVIGDNMAPGSSSWDYYAPGGVFLGNVVVLPSTTSAAKFPVGNNYPTSTATIGFVNLAANDFRLSSTSPYKGKATDGRDPGADVNTVNSMTANVIVP